jgi:hypothetical protein
MDVERVVRTHISSNDSVDEVPQDLLEGVYSRSFQNSRRTALTSTFTIHKLYAMAKSVS